ncbi:MAG TPA: O-antigen ligase family protein [Bryobacteraceae bacterium]|nr:O-antigen ligase family protein [Bryobacteraceae bacterium]
MSKRSPGVLLLLVACYVVLLPYQFEVERQLHLAPSDSFLLLALALAAGRWKYRKPAWTIWHFAIALTFVMGTLLIALRNGRIERYELFNKDVGLLLPFVSYAAVTSAVASWTDLRRILKVFVLGVVGENILAVAGFLASYFFGFANPFARYEGLRLSGMLLDPNAYGGLLVTALVVSEAASWGRSPLFAGFTLWFSRITLLLGILFTFSRTAWTGLGVALLLAGLIRPRVLLRPVFAAVAGGPILLLIMGHRFVPLFERMARRPEQVQERFDLAQRALESFARHPFLGGGIGSFRLAAGVVAHNSAMWFLADFGLVGLTALMGFLGWFFAKAWLAYRRAPESEQPVALSLLLAHAAMVGVAMGIEAFYQRHLWLICALIASSHCLTLRPENYRLCESEVLAHAC